MRSTSRSSGRVDTRHLPLYWFPRDCPRATFWAESRTTDDDAERFLGGDRLRRVHAIEGAWLEGVRTARVVAYRLPDDGFERWDRFWISRAAVEPLDLVELGDLLACRAEAAIELRIVPELPSLWGKVVNSTPDYSGIRLRNARMAP